MINLLVKIYKRFYWRFFHRLWRLAERHYINEYFYNIFEKDDFKHNVLTDEQKLEIDIFYKKNYGKKISYDWHNLFKKYSGKFDVKYFPINVFIEYLYSSNITSKQWDILKDKNFLYEIAKFANVKVPKRYFYSINDIFFDSGNKIISKDKFYESISNLGEAFIKPTEIYNTGYAKNCRLINVLNGIDSYSGTNIKDIIKKNYNNDFVVQEKIVCHKSISDIYPKSVNTIGLSTIILNKEIKVIKPLLKIGMNGNNVDFRGFKNKCLMVPVKADGTLYDKAYCINENKYYLKHPDTGVIFKNYKLENFHKILDEAKKIQSCIPWMSCCGMDFVLDKNRDAVVIEIENPSCFLGQTLYGEGFFCTETEQILSFLKNRRKNNKLL